MILDKAAFEKNAERMDEILKGSSLSLRPHYKSHKCAAIAHDEIRRGAVGITCAKLDKYVGFR